MRLRHMVVKKILIVQSFIPHYRKPLFNQLSKYYDVTVLHSGEKTVQQNDNYKEIITKKIKIGIFIYQYAVLRNVKSSIYHAVIVMSDLHWINNILAVYFRSPQTKFIWFGTWPTANTIANKIKIHLTNFNSLTIVYTEGVKASLIKLGARPENLFVANNTFYIENRQKCYENPKKNKILFVGSLHARKENNILIEAFHAIKRKLPEDICLIIIGNGAEKDNLINLTHKLKLNKRISFVDELTDTDKLLGFYKEAILSVSYGQSGLFVLQSFGYGIPFLTRRNALGVEKHNIIESENGLFCDDNIHSLQEKLLKVCTDVKYARDMGKNAYDYYTKFCTMPNMVQGFINALAYK